MESRFVVIAGGAGLSRKSGAGAPHSKLTSVALQLAFVGGELSRRCESYHPKQVSALLESHALNISWYH